MIIQLWRDFVRNPWQGKYVLPLVIINAAGSFYGYYWYHLQLAETPFYWWPLVADSPFSTTLFTFALLFGSHGRRGGWLPVLACVSCLKYGFWAVVLITHYWWEGNRVAFLEALLWLSHWGMVLEGWFYLRPLDLRVKRAVFPALYLLVNDFTDYVLGLHPYLFLEGQAPVAALTAAGLTAALWAVLAVKACFSNNRSAGQL